MTSRKSFTFRLDDQLHAALVARHTSEGVSAQKLLEDMVRSELYGTTSDSSIRVPDDLHTLLKVYCVIAKQSPSAVIERWLRQKLEEPGRRAMIEDFLKRTSGPDGAGG